jgi:hypothetical protein
MSGIIDVAKTNRFTFGSFYMKNEILQTCNYRILTSLNRFKKSGFFYFMHRV